MYRPPSHASRGRTSRKLYREGRDRLAELEARLTSPRPRHLPPGLERQRWFPINRVRPIPRASDDAKTTSAPGTSIRPIFLIVSPSTSTPAAPRPEITAYATALYGRLRDVNLALRGAAPLPDSALVSNSPSGSSVSPDQKPARGPSLEPGRVELARGKISTCTLNCSPVPKNAPNMSCWSISSAMTWARSAATAPMQVNEFMK